MKLPAVVQLTLVPGAVVLAGPGGLGGGPGGFESNGLGLGRFGPGGRGGPWSPGPGRPWDLGPAIISQLMLTMRCGVLLGLLLVAPWLRACLADHTASQAASRDLIRCSTL
ncbi:hypothetical protein CRG98_042438 [Punica granatum]|uniref:Uncharacterized protein n=1 Tax=Punica granatum TaxID=22663 RepID=A0A2I0HZN5_PUNGR|nr:hypothetical protein CRG98_042438 [Punica granatum]